MAIIIWPGNSLWSPWHKIIFRFFFLYFCLLLVPKLFVTIFFNVDLITSSYAQFENWIVHIANRDLFHTYQNLSNSDSDGINDNSYGWTLIRLYIIVAFLGDIIWSIADWNRKNYNFFGYWFRIVLRYFAITALVGYGLDKVFLLQMPFPGTAQLSLPIGDVFGQGLLWQSMGYATKYQLFAGILETLAGALMLFRRTSTLGTLLGFAAFLNVFMTNVGYDINVKLFSLHLTIICLVLLAFEYRRLTAFFLFNSGAVAGNLYAVSFSKRWQRTAHLLLKCVFVWQIFIMTCYHDIREYSNRTNRVRANPIIPGVYNVTSFVVNGNPVPPLLTDSIRWEKIMFNDWGNWGYITPYDTLFKKRLDVGFFAYALDTLKREIRFMKSEDDSQSQASFLMNYEFPDSNTISLVGKIHQDSVSVLLNRSHKKIILIDSKMQWLKEDDWYKKYFDE